MLNLLCRVLLHPQFWYETEDAPIPHHVSVISHCVCGKIKKARLVRVGTTMRGPIDPLDP